MVNKGEESDVAFAKRVLDALAGRGSIMVLNDEAHHAYRPAPVDDEQLSKEDRADHEEATVWIAGLDRINAAVGIRCCIDLSATAFYLHGSGYVEGSPFPWLVSDFGLVDAIESGIVKIPRMPVSDTTGRPEPKYFALWRHITDKLRGGERLPDSKPKPEVVRRESQDALLTLASQWVERYEQVQTCGSWVWTRTCSERSNGSSMPSSRTTLPVNHLCFPSSIGRSPLAIRHGSFKTIRPCVPTTKSQIDQVVSDTTSGEQAAVIRLEHSPAVVSYARNDHVELSISYEYLGTPHSYFPDFLVLLVSGVSVRVEIRGMEDEQDQAKHQAARRWVGAVNRWGREGQWAFVVCRDPQQLGPALAGVSPPS